MKIILKFVLTNILEKKFRTFLIILAVLISTALFFASSAISTSMEAMLLGRMQKYTGSADILIQAGEDESRFFNPNIISPWGDELSYAAGTLGAHGFYQGSDDSAWFQVQGVDWAEVGQWNPVTLAQQDGLQPFRQNKIILGDAVAERLGLSLGDSLELEIDGIGHEFTLAGIAASQGPFQEDGTIFAMIPRTALAGILEQPGMVTAMYLQGKDAQQVEALLTEMQALLPGFSVLEAGLDPQSQMALDNIVMPFMLITVIIFLLSAYIIYTSFRLITVERLPVIGTFRSVGATKAKTNLVLLAEGLVYGVIGGVLGCLLGQVVLRLMARNVASAQQVTQTFIVFTWGQVGTAMAAAVILAFFSSLLPILATSKVSLKDIILNSFEHSRKRGSTRTIAGAAMVVIALVIPRFAGNSTLLPVSLLAVFMLLAATVMLVPFVTGLLVGIVGKLYGLVAGNIGLLAAKNLRENQNILNSITLLALGIATLLTINTLSFSVLESVTNVWGENITHDIAIQVPGDTGVLEEIAATEGVTEVMPTVSAHSVAVEGSQYNINWLEGVNPQQYLNFYNMDVSQQTLDLLGQGRNILLGTFMASLLEVVPGDAITLETSSGPREYTVVGVLPVLFNNGSFGVIDIQWLQEDMQIKYYTDFLVNAQDPEITAVSLREGLNYRRAQVFTIASLEEENYSGNAQMFMILKGFSILMMVIGIVGVINNLLVSFLQRRRVLAMLRSVGMSRVQIRTMVLWESLTGGVIGGGIGVGSGLLLLAVLPWVLDGMLLPVPVILSPSLLVWSWLAGVTVMVLASVAPAFNSSRLNIIQAINFE